ncbi:TonB-dependent receptor [Phocaeicola faecicola]|uniref:SusC/RagA family TonB-linked outer membrane protein n=1 Tax=Phocaeicola faecicola TaxID=2739389 RepID=UPI002A82F0CD|nr:TonB-dependent receptor [Phocaeicola faecicola]MCI5743812.1 TonB-dependent receptor [Bacteroides sp.]MDD6908247.1 TonB-dependent receptor [Bacteroidaceae bacterium]MDY4871656.1 TonB-dependent receptor [Phocaeicola faecicola]
MCRLVLLFVLFFIGTSAYAQNMTVTGRVIDDDGIEVIGASVVVKGATGVGTITDLDGNYSLTVNDTSRDVLVFSYVGMTSQEVKVGGRKVINVTLKSDAVMLDEVVTIGYATVKKKDLTGSVSSVSSKDIASVPISDVTQALSGKVAGVQVMRSQGSPDADISIKVRGGTSITQSNEPLYIIDGFPSEDGLKGIEASDIASIDILKDASSTAIYGARGANGVILVTTKGGNVDKFNISYDMYIGFKKVNKRYDVLDVLDFVKLEYERSINEPDKMNDFVLPIYGNYDEYDELYANRQGIDWQDEVFNRSTAMTQQHKISLSGGSKTSQYMLTYTRNVDDGIWYGSGLKRDNFRVKLSQEATSWLKFSTNISYIDEVTEGLGSLQEGGASSRMQHVIQYRPTIGKNGNDEQLLIDDDDPALLLEGASQMQSPIASIESEQRTKRNQILSMNGDLEIRLPKDLTYRGTIGIRRRTIKTDIFYSERSKQAKNAGAPYGWKEIEEQSSFMYNNVLTWDKSFNREHHLTLVAGQEYIQYGTDYLKSGARQFSDINFGPADMSLGASPDKVITRLESEKMLSYFMRGNYSLKDKYLFSASVRADASSKFGDNHKWGVFPAASFAWRASEEEFVKKWGIFSNLKVRLSYGSAGNNKIDNYLSLSKMGSVWIPYNGTSTVSGFVSKQLYNPDLQWETNVTSNFGLDMGFLNQRIQLTVDLYNINTKNLLLDAPIPLLSGYKSMMINAGRTNNRGIELALTTHNINTKDFSWSTTLNLSHNRNEVKELYNADYMEIVSNWAQTSEFNKSDYIIRVGEPLGQMYGYRLAGIYTVDDFTFDEATQKYTVKEGIPYDKNFYPKPGFWKFEDLDGDKQITESDKTVIGNANPKLYGGLTNNFTWKGFDLSIFLNFSIGNKIYSANKMYYTKFNNRWRNTLKDEALQRFTIINDKGENIQNDPVQLAAVNAGRNYVSVEGSSNLYFHSGYVEDGSFLKINNVSLGYTLPKSLIKKIHLSNVRFYATGYNLYTFTKYSGYDPEVNTYSNGGLTPGIDWGAYPSSISVVFGANITF